VPDPPTGLSERAAGTVARGGDIAASSAQGARLNEFLRLSEKYGAGGVRELGEGRIRFYGELIPAAKAGEMAGARLVREWNPGTSAYRTWYETLDQSGRIRQVHPYDP
jgi:filamentous hemagglutinin